MSRSPLALGLAVLAVGCGAPPLASPPPTAAKSTVASKPRLLACVAEDGARAAALAAFAEGKIDRGLRRLDAIDARCPDEARRTAIPRLRALAQGGRVDAAETLAATLAASEDGAEKAAAAEAKQILASLPTKEEALREASAWLGKDAARAQRLLDQARFAYEREAGATAHVDDLGAADRGGRVRWNKHGIFEAQSTRVVLFDPSDLAPRRVFELGEPIWSLAVAADVLVAAGPTRARVWSVASGSAKDIAGVAAPVALGGDGVLLAAAEPSTHAVRLLPLSGAGPTILVPGKHRPVQLALSPDTKRLAIRRVEDSVDVVLTATGALHKTVAESSANAMVFGPDSDRLYFGRWHDIHWVSVDKGTKSPLAQNKRAAIEIAFHPKGLQIASAGTLTVRLWDPVTLVGHNGEGSMKGHTDEIVSVDYSPDGERLVTSSNDGTLRIWDPMKGTAVATHAAARPHVATALSASHWVFVPPAGAAYDIELAGGRHGAFPLGGCDRSLALHDDRVLCTTKAHVELLSLGGPSGPERVFRRAEPFHWADFDGAGAPRAFQQVVGLHALHPTTGATLTTKPVAGSFGASPDGRYALVRTINRAALYDLVAQKSKVLDQTTPEWIGVYDWTGGVFSADSKTLYLPWQPHKPAHVEARSVVRAYSTATGAVTATYEIGRTVTALALGDHDTLLVGTKQAVEVWDRATGKRLRSVAVPSGVEDVHAGPQAGLVARGRDLTLTLFDGEGAPRLVVTPARNGLLFVDREGAFTVKGEAPEVRCVVGTHVLPRVLCEERFGGSDVVASTFAPPKG